MRVHLLDSGRVVELNADRLSLAAFLDESVDLPALTADLEAVQLLAVELVAVLSVRVEPTEVVRVSVVVRGDHLVNDERLS